MKIPKLSRNTWIAVGGIGATIAAYVLSTRVGGASSGYDPFAQQDYAQLPGGSTEPPDDGADSFMAWDPITTAPQQSGAFASETPAFSAPAPVQRTASVSAPAYYVDASGKQSPLAEIFSQRFNVAQPVASPVYQAAAPTRFSAPAYLSPAPVVASSIPDRFRSLFGLAAIHGDGGARDPFAGESAPPPSTVIYVDPIIARNLKFPGGGLASPLGVETFIGGGGSGPSDGAQPNLSA